MKIYHTETQADYDALMTELKEQGCNETLEKDYWKLHDNQMVVFVHNVGPYGDSSRTDTTYGSLRWAIKHYPTVPITKYKAKVDEKMKFTKENVLNITDKWIESKIISFQDLQNEIKELDDTPEKVAIPEFIANYLSRAKTDVGLMRVFEIANTKNELGKWKKEYNWIRKNSEKFAKAWIDGYNIEPEQL